jgi:hypothetical protein
VPLSVVDHCMKSPPCRLFPRIAPCGPPWHPSLTGLLILMVAVTGAIALSEGGYGPAGYTLNPSESERWNCLPDRPGLEPGFPVLTVSKTGLQVLIVFVGAFLAPTVAVMIGRGPQEPDRDG